MGFWLLYDIIKFGNKIMNLNMSKKIPMTSKNHDIIEGGLGQNKQRWLNFLILDLGSLFCRK